MPHVLTGFFLSLFILYGLLEYHGHRKRLRMIPVRIHVNGSRGKSSVVRMIAAVLGESGMKVYARITGTLPIHLLPDGREKAIIRTGGPRILELVETVRIAAAGKADVLVVECMALKPEYQRFSEEKLLLSTHAVVTNVREDHLEVMGPGLQDAARAMSVVIPRHGTVVIGEKRWEPIFREIAGKKSTELLLSKEFQVDPGSAGDDGVAFFGENAALVRTLCSELGVPENIVRRGLEKHIPDPGSLSTFFLDLPIGRVTAVNAFAANDPVSTENIVKKMDAAGLISGPLMLVFNHRQDRIMRSLSFIPFFIKLCEYFRLQKIVLIGTGSLPVLRKMKKAGLDAGMISIVRGNTAPEKIMDIVLSGIERLEPDSDDCEKPRATILGMGNFAGAGEQLIQFWRQKGTLHA